MIEYWLSLQRKRNGRLRTNPHEVPVEFSELVRLLERNGFSLHKENGSIRYYSSPGNEKLIRVDYHNSREVTTGTCHAILEAAGIRETR